MANLTEKVVATAMDTIRQEQASPSRDGSDRALLQRAFTDFRIAGAILPSSAALAAALASLAIGYDQVLELGAGSGAVTQALTEVVRAENLVVVELQARLAAFLKQRFPHLNVVQGPADSVLDKLKHDRAVAVVSSLPFRSLPADIKAATAHSVMRFLAASPDSTFIQFTYGLREPFRVSSGFEWTRVKWVFANIPPARIWTLNRSGCQYRT